MAAQHRTETVAPEFPAPKRTCFPDHAIFRADELDDLQQAFSGLRAILHILDGDDLAAEMNADAAPCDDLEPRLSAVNRDGLLSAALVLVARADYIVDRHANMEQAERDHAAREALVSKVSRAS